MKSSFYITGYLRNQENIFKLSKRNKKDLVLILTYCCMDMQMRQPLATQFSTSVTRGLIVRKIKEMNEFDTRLLGFEAQWLCILTL